MLEREGLTNSWDIALSGSYEQVAEGLQRYEESGGTQVVAAVYGPDEARQQTVSELAQLMA
jgi:alkanesulfonate monooxygenase SsuD/methylene tetrahydromethanopterin reductase-like flavin-dependent oxidoreductase (luciferase family)